MKSKLLAATAIPLVSLLAGASLANAEAFNRPILIAQAEEPTCAEGDAECEARKNEAAPATEETAPASEEAPATNEAAPEQSAEEPAPAQPEQAAPEETAPAESQAEPPADESTPASETPTEETPVEESTPDNEAEPATETQEPAPETEQQATEPATAEEPPASEAAPQTSEDAAQSEEEPAASEPAPETQAAPAEEAQPTENPGATDAETQSPPTAEEAPVPKPKPDGETQSETTPEQMTAPAQAEEPAPESEQTSEENSSEMPAIDQEKLKIAEDPANAEGTVELPVEDGAPILDSAKEAAPESGEAETQAQEPAQIQAVPESDADAQATGESEESTTTNTQQAITSVRERTGTRLESRPRYEQPEGRVVDEENGRMIFDFGNGITIRFNDSERIAQDSQDSYYEELPGGYTRQVVVRRNGDEVITIRNRWGDIVQRSRIRDGREYVLYYDPDGYEGNRRGDNDLDRGYYDPGRDLPPMRLPVPLSDYIIDTSSDRERDYVEFLSKPPVERVERIYSLDEVRNSARIRDKVRRIDLDTITFETGSAEVSMNEARSLRQVADAINQILENDPGETFLIEGHTDAVGSDESNLILSDERAESVAQILTGLFDIPPENLATQGYGERYLKVRTAGPERLNRRVTIRRVTPLVRPASARVIE